MRLVNSILFEVLVLNEIVVEFNVILESFCE